jgi:hypothetical protein
VTFNEVLSQTIAMLHQHGRVSYRALKRQFALDDDYLADLTDASIGKTNGLFHRPRASTRCRAPWPPTRWRLPRATGSAPQFATAHARSGRLASQRKPPGGGRACLRPGSSWSVRQPKRNPGRRSMTSVLPRSTSPLMAPSCQRVSPATSVKEPPQQRCLSRPCAPALCRAAAAPPRRAGRPGARGEAGPAARREKCFKLPSMLPLLSSPLAYVFLPPFFGCCASCPGRSGDFLWGWD